MHGGAHFLEHLLFKGAGAHGVGEAAERVEAMGGDLNAFTSYEQTCLHGTVPAGREAEVLRLLAEMARRPHLDAAEIERERDVVIEEIRANQDDAMQVLAENLRARVYGDHPYARPVLGTEDSVRGLGREGLLALHARGFAPSNAVLAVAGPVDPSLVQSVAAELLSEGPPAPPDLLPPTPGEPSGARFFHERLEVAE